MDCTILLTVCSEPPTCKATLVSLHHTGRAGQPKKTMNREWLREAVSAKRYVPMKVLANLLGIHRNTLQYKLREMGLYQ
jgi:DNA-binding NtrC family response regulator